MEKTIIPNVLTIAGVDPSGGAGVLADIKAISALGGYGCGVIAALTAQNTCAVTGVCPVPASFVREQLETLFEDVRIDAVKIGMLSDVAVIEEVARALERYRPRFVVLDPVMVAKSGDRLLPENCVQALKTKLLPLATVLTPNLPEAAVLAGEAEITQEGQMLALADKLLPLMGKDSWLLLKGGHLTGAEVPDLLTNGEVNVVFKADRIETKNTHGTGCALSSALATLLPQCETVPEAVSEPPACMTVRPNMRNAPGKGSQFCATKRGPCTIRRVPVRSVIQMNLAALWMQRRNQPNVIGTDRKNICVTVLQIIRVVRQEPSGPAAVVNIMPTPHIIRSAEKSVGKQRQHSRW